MRFCFSTYSQVLMRCKAKGITQKALGRALLSVLNGGDGSYYSDTDISDLFNGKKDVSPADLESARTVAIDEMGNRFKEAVLPLIDENSIRELIAALIALIETDDSIREETTVDLVCNASKESLLSDGVSDKEGFLAGTYLYVALKAENKNSKEDAQSIRDEGLPSLKHKDTRVDETEHLPSEGASRVLIRCGNGGVELRSGDLFSFAEGDNGASERYENIVVIPVETTFCTRLADPLDVFDGNYISEKTIHGIFLKRWSELGCSADTLDSLIWDNLRKRYGPDAIAEKRMPLGTIAAVPGKGCCFYLLAISEYEDDGRTHSSEAEIESAVISLLEFYDRYGQGNRLYMPIMGTGRSRANLDLQRSAKMIVDTMRSNQEIIHGDITLMMLPIEYAEIDVEEL